MKKIILILAFLSVFFAGCTLASFTKTGGGAYPPLPETAPVDVVLRSVPDYPFEVIGIVTVQGGTIHMMIEKAQAVARENGANVLVLVGQVGKGVYTLEVGRRLEQPKSPEKSPRKN
ncbi:hypothetical protein ACE5IS_02870 [Leptospira wolffii]|uniref:Lipoprotein n=1 Tax=Leptospira wolffii TaxID=409998 RepID=A0ABV5BKT4_9LEPT|nr:hypothetical protein [Leptospira wolffii]TGL49495.1 hypothetical protein EHQ61_13720 [Leptospira wolffii]